jgi:hypothetical protein
MRILMFFPSVVRDSPLNKTTLSNALKTIRSVLFLSRLNTAGAIDIIWHQVRSTDPMPVSTILRQPLRDRIFLNLAEPSAVPAIPRENE